MSQRAFSRLLVSLVLGHWSLVISAFAADWPQWRGPNRDGFTTETLPASFATAPKQLWQIPVGHGYAGPVVAENRLLLVAEAAGQETAHWLDTATGQVLWAEAVGETFADEFEPGPRCVPVLDGDRAYTQSCRGEFRCLNLKDGSTRWRFHFRDYGATWSEEKSGGVGAANRRGNSGSPLVLGDRVLVQIGSVDGASLAAFDKLTGKLLWKTANDLTTYSSPVVSTLAGRSQFLSATCEGLLSVAPENGSELWRLPFKTYANRNVLTPIVADDTVYFASHSTGFRAVKVTRDGEAFRAADVWLNRDLKLNLSTPVLVRGHLYGLGPAKNYVCLDAATGTVRWSQPGFDAVASTVTDGRRLLVTNDKGEVLLLAANPERFEELGRFQATGKTFSHPALAAGVLYLRDSRVLTAYRLP
jgi:outer membrane protein assembly factor BamB